MSNECEVRTETFKVICQRDQLIYNRRERFAIIDGKGLVNPANPCEQQSGDQICVECNKSVLAIITDDPRRSPLETILPVTGNK